MEDLQISSSLSEDTSVDRAQPNIEKNVEEGAVSETSAKALPSLTASAPEVEEATGSGETETSCPIGEDQSMPEISGDVAPSIEESVVTELTALTTIMELREESEEPGKSSSEEVHMDADLSQKKTEVEIGLMMLQVLRNLSPRTSLGSTQTAPSDSTQSAPSDSTQSAPSDSTQSAPSDSTQSAPSDSTPSAPSDSTPSAPSDSTPSAPSDSTPSAPSDSTPTVCLELYKRRKRSTLPPLCITPWYDFGSTQTAPPAGTQTAPPAGTHTAPPAGTHTAPPAGTHTAPPAGTHTAPPAGTQTAPDGARTVLSGLFKRRKLPPLGTTAHKGKQHGKRSESRSRATGTESKPELVPNPLLTVTESTPTERRASEKGAYMTHIVHSTESCIEEALRIASTAGTCAVPVVDVLSAPEHCPIGSNAVPDEAQEPGRLQVPIRRGEARASRNPDPNDGNGAIYSLCFVGVFFAVVLFESFIRRSS